jgi:hypothetical protein
VGPQISAGSVHAFYLFDVAEGVNLTALRQRFGEKALAATLLDKAPRAASGPLRPATIGPGG